MQESNRVAVMMVPFLAHSHLNQLLQLSCSIASTYPEISVHYVSSSIHIEQVRARSSPSPGVERVRFHGLSIADFESPPPDPDSPNKFPTQLQPSWNASLSLREPFASLLRGVSRECRRVVVVHDFMMSFVVRDVASIDNAESYVFNPVSALTMASFASHSSIPRELSNDLRPFEDSLSHEITELIALQGDPSECRSGDLFNTVRSLEAPFLNLLAREEISKEGRKTWAIGPVLPKNRPGRESENSKHRCLEWLDVHEPGSVIYVSFGTTTSLSDEQIGELAIGLEQSGANFLWVLRDADRGNALDGDARRIELPLGFEERVGGVGLVVRDWAPQLEILAHPSTGGFMSHCGWNSCLESLMLGVPLATWPMHSDQPRNAHLVTEILKAGIVVREWARRGEVMKASVVAEVVRRLMVADEGEGGVVRERAREIGSSLRRATEEGGESKVEMDSFVAHITRK